MEVELIYTNIGLANRFDYPNKTIIELNKNLLKSEYKNLHNALLTHEYSHSNKVISKQDFKVDFIESNSNSLEVIRFMLKHPKSFTQLFPIYYSKERGFVYDINLIILYTILTLITTITAYISWIIL